MVHVDLTCAAIRLTPVWICIAAHCSNGDWPTSLEAAIRVIDYGFSMETFRRRPEVLLTHLFVHANDAHLRGNMAALVTTLIGFGGSSVEENLMETSITKCIRRTLSSLVVFIGGGIIGGLGGQLLFNDAQRKRRYGGWLTAPALRESAAGGVSPVSAIAERVRRWANDMAYRVDKKRGDSIYMCGSSAGICALAGFNASYYQRWFSALVLVLPDVVAVASSMLNPPSRMNITLWLPAGEVVGHAAHLGGFAVGAAMGAAARWWCDRRDSRVKKRSGEKYPG